MFKVKYAWELNNDCLNFVVKQSTTTTTTKISKCLVHSNGRLKVK